MIRRVRMLLVPPLAAALTACAGGAPPAGGPSPVEGAPSTDVYLYNIGGLPFISRGRVANLTNRAGYDNQPMWDGHSRLLYTSQHAGQFDIYAIDFSANRIDRVTDTPESEYSAAPSPDGRALTVVRVERDSAQRLWNFPRDGSAPALLLPGVRPVGYFAWLDTARLALFVLGNPNSLQIADTRTGQSVVVANGIGRSLQRMPGGTRASFLHRVGNRWVLKAVDPTPRPDGTFRIDSLAVMPDSADYVVWRSPTEAYSAAGSRVLRLRLPEGRWDAVADLAEHGIQGITRLALSPDGRRLAVVAAEARP